MDELIKKLRERRAAIKATLDGMIRDEAGELRDLSEAEDAAFKVQVNDLRAVDDRIDELVQADMREKLAASAYVAPTSAKTTATVAVTNEPNPVYRKNDNHGPSFFKDLMTFQLNLPAQGEARSRLAASQETRVSDMTTVAGAGGEFAPPLWLVGDFVALARPGRVAADLSGVKNDLPSGVSSINLPKVSAGATVAVQATQNTAGSDTAMTTTSVTSGITTLIGKQVISMQLLQQSGIPFDEVILSDLALAYAGALDVQVLTGSGSSGQLRGLKNGASVGATTFTSASPAVTSATSANSFYNKIISAMNSIYTARYLPPDAILMHPQRWSWVLEGLDSQVRPLVVPNGPMFNGIGTDNGPTAQGATGTLLGLPVFVDPNVPVNIGAGTNQDVVYVGRFADVFLWESPIQQASFDATYADQASILFRVLGYSAFIPDRQGAAINAINGTGLVTPTL
jgi:HK97 family phage major capsid protein